MRGLRGLWLLLIILFTTPCLVLGLDAPHTNVPGYGLECGSCHWTHSMNTPPWGTIVNPLDPADDTLNNRRCYICHDGSKPIVGAKTHSSSTTSTRYWTTQGNWKTECVTCHDPHQQRQTRAWRTTSHLEAGSPPQTIGSWNTSLGNWTTITLGSAVADNFLGYYFMPDKTQQYYYKVLDETTNATSFRVKGGVLTANVLAGGYAFVYGKNVRENIWFTNPGGARVGGQVKQFRPGGLFGPADSANTSTSVCYVCHTLTRHWSSASPDMHGDGTNCTICHKHLAGFSPCGGPWGSYSASATDCVSCHKFPMCNRRQIVDSNADGTGTGGDFIKSSHHHYPAAGTVTNAICLVCHDTSQHPGGAVRLKDADTGAIYTYDPANPVTVEDFCLSCHDANGANGNMSPFSDGKVLGVAPYRAGIDIKANWNKTYGHRQKGLSCLGDGSPNTGCHANGHGSGFVGLLSKNLLVPNPSSAYYSPADEGSFDICFSCHQSFPLVTKEVVMGYRLGSNFDVNGQGPPPYNIVTILTMFRDKNNLYTGKIYDDSSFFGAYFQAHYFHVKASGWNYRGTLASSMSCITCHSVHGSNTQWGWVYDEMQYNRYTSGGDQYGSMGPLNFNYSPLAAYPTNCTFNCHSIQGKTYNWQVPSGE